MRSYFFKSVCISLFLVMPLHAFSWGFLGTALSKIAYYILPGYIIKKAFDKDHDKVDQHGSGSLTSTKTGPITIAGNAKVFMGCTLNGGLNVEGTGNVQFSASEGINGHPEHKVAFSVEPPSYKERAMRVVKNFISSNIQWLNNHKLSLTGISCATVYGYYLLRVFSLQRFINSKQCWGIWHDEYNFNDLTSEQRTRLQEELLVEVRSRYPHNNDLVPIHSFMNDIDQEAALYYDYARLVARIDVADWLRRCITNRFRDAYSGFLGNTEAAQIQSERIFDYCNIKRWLRINEALVGLCIKRREHVLHLKAFYAEWLTSVRAIYKQRK